MKGFALMRSSPRRNRGLGLVELVVSLAIAAMLLTAVAAAYSATTTAIEMNDQFFRASQAARVSINQIMAEVRRCQSGVVDDPSLELTTQLGQKRLYTFDNDTKRITMTFPDEPTPPTYVLARNVDESSLAELQASRGIGAVDIRTPSLEEIFVSVMRDKDAPAADSVVEAGS